MIAKRKPTAPQKPATTTCEPVFRELEDSDLEWVLKQQREICLLREIQLQRDGHICHNGKVIENAK